jgi:hypothetical protein
MAGEGVLVEDARRVATDLTGALIADGAAAAAAKRHPHPAVAPERGAAGLALVVVEFAEPDLN